MINKLNKKYGFTLAELLVVVAIIAVLVAVAIPVFSTQLEKSREATDLANVRSAYAKLRVVSLSDDIADSGVEETESGYQISVSLKQKKSDWQTSDNLNIGGIEMGDSNWQGVPEENGICTISYNKANDQTIINWGDGTASGNGTTSQSVYLASEGVWDKIVSSFSKNNNGDYDSTAPDQRSDGTTTGTSIAKKYLEENGIDMSAMGVETWRVHKDGNKIEFYATPVNLKDLSSGTIVPVIKMNKGSDGSITYSVGNKTVEPVTNISKEKYNHLNADSGSYTICSNYNDAVTKLNEMLQTNSNFSNYSMNTMPEN